MICNSDLHVTIEAFVCLYVQAYIYLTVVHLCVYLCYDEIICCYYSNIELF